MTRPLFATLERWWPGWGMALLGLGGVVAVHLPWHVHPVAALTNNAFDLAEFASLHPATRAENPALLTSLLLRLPLALLAASIALAANRFNTAQARWLWRGMALLVALRLNPPIDFYRNPTGVSLNEQHLAALTALGLGLVLGVIVLGRWLRPLDAVWQSGLWLALGLSGWIGLGRATTTIETLQIEVTYGAGIYVLLALTVLAITLNGYRLLNRPTRDS